MENQAQENLLSNTFIILIDKGYTNNEIKVTWLKYFIKYSSAKEDV